MAKPLVTEIKKAIWRVDRIIKATLLFTKIFISILLFSIWINLSKSAKKQWVITLIQSLSFFVFELPHIEIKGDFELLNLVLQNFISNAIDAIEESENESGCVCIVHQPDETSIILHIMDDGKAIENEHLV